MSKLSEHELRSMHNVCQTIKQGPETVAPTKLQICELSATGLECLVYQSSIAQAFLQQGCTGLRA